MSDPAGVSTSRRMRREIGAILIGILVVIGLYASFELADVWMSGELVRHYEDAAAAEADNWGTAELPEGIVPEAAQDIRIAVHRGSGGVLLRYHLPAENAPVGPGDPVTCPARPEPMRARGWWCEPGAKLEARCDPAGWCVAFDPEARVVYWSSDGSGAE